jgi:hypothetical protein
MTKTAISWKYILAELYVEDRTELAIVSERWTIDENVLKYPSNLKGPKRMKSIMDHVIPEDTWTEYEYRRIRVCGKFTHE